MSFYEKVEHQVPTWQLPTQQPLVLIAQLKAMYHQASPQDGRVRRQFDASERQLVWAALDAVRAFDAQFLVFPEYTCPSLEVNELLLRLQHALPVGSACILPLEHVPFAEFANLLSEVPGDRTFLSAFSEQLKNTIPTARIATALINVTLTILQTRDGLHVVPQAKLRPAAFEEPASLGSWQLWGGGQRVIVQGANCTFAVVVCFDLIAQDQGHNTIVRELLGDLPSLDLLFVVECNPKPFHEQYSQAVLDLCLEPAWKRTRPVMLFANAAFGTRLPRPVDRFAFGFSRAFGRLGETTPPVPFVTIVGQDALLESGVPVASVETLQREAQRLHLRGTDFLIIRPHESLWAVRPPTLRSGPSGDPAVGRTDTESEVLRYVGGAGGDRPWRKVHAMFQLPTASDPVGIPTDLIIPDGLVGYGEIGTQFLDLLRTTSKPVWVTGDGGVGKTALVANVLHSDVEALGTANVLWLDMAYVGPSEEDLLEDLLLALGKPQGLSETLDSQWEIVEQAFRDKHLILVLDSEERWAGGVLPARLANLAHWPGRLVVTGRRAPANPDLAEVIQLTGLEYEAIGALLRRTSGQSDSDVATALYEDLNGSPLACVWAGGVLRRAADPTSELRDLIVALQEKSIISLEDLFDWCVQRVSPADLQVLAVLCELPSGVTDEDLAAILARPREELRLSMGHLVRLHLAMNVRAPGETTAGAHTRHPFVRQFFQRRADGHFVWPQIVAWADAVLSTSGGDANWAGFKTLAPRWRNIRHVLDRLAADDIERFLKLWRAADYFLWISGRWRERIRFGRIAEERARAAGLERYRAHALLDSIAETEWHRRWDVTDAEPLLAEAASIYTTLGDLNGASHVEYYRSRLYRKGRRFAESIAAARTAIDLAQKAGARLAEARGYHALGNTFRSQRQFGDAQKAYGVALPVFADVDQEMEAVARRALGQVALEQGDYWDALVQLETAFDRFVELGAFVEAAEAGLHHAVVLASLGEIDEAQVELRNMAHALDRLGSVVRRRDVESARRRIDVLAEST